MAKGQKTGGRIKGTPNKLTSTTKEVLSNFLNENLSQILETEFEQLEPREKVDVIIKLIPYVVPKMQSIRNEFDQLSDEDLDKIIEQLTQKANE